MDVILATNRMFYPNSIEIQNRSRHLKLTNYFVLYPPKLISFLNKDSTNLQCRGKWQSDPDIGEIQLLQLNRITLELRPEI